MLFVKYIRRDLHFNVIRNNSFIDIAIKLCDVIIRFHD